MNIHYAKFSGLLKGVVFFCFSCLLAMNAAAGTPEVTLQEFAQDPFGEVIFMRHAYAPGMDANGQPAKFKLNDCATQRNLDARGRQQAISLGDKFRQTGIKIGVIYSSQWCRCLETARLLKLGEVFPETALNSGFKGLFDKQQNLSNLRKILASLRANKNFILMVTHNGTISAITGISIKSGGVIAYDVKTKTSKIIFID